MGQDSRTAFEHAAARCLPGFLYCFNIADLKSWNNHLGIRVGDQNIQELERLLHELASNSAIVERIAGQRWLMVSRRNENDRVQALLDRYKRTERVSVGWRVDAALNGTKKVGRHTMPTELTRAVRCLYAEVKSSAELTAAMTAIEENDYDLPVNRPVPLSAIPTLPREKWCSVAAYPEQKPACPFCQGRDFKWEGGDMSYYSGEGRCRGCGAEIDIRDASEPISTQAGASPVTADSDNPASRTARPPLWSWRRLWPAIVLLAIVGLYVNEHQESLKKLQDANEAIAATIHGMTPWALIDGFKERAKNCHYIYMVYCAAEPKAQPERKTKRPLIGCMRWVDDCPPETPNPGSAAVATVWSTIRTIAQLPDTTWFMIKKTWGDGYLPFGLLTVFILINIAVATRFPVLLWPISLPLTTATASGLFALVEQLFLFGVGVEGAVIEVLLFLFAGSYFVTPFIVACCKHIHTANDLQDIAHKIAEVMGRTAHIRG
ncbi:MAG: diguanylate cyclase domain-containing protein [Xanthobacteraceae bacterium]